MWWEEASIHTLRMSLIMSHTAKSTYLASLYIKVISLHPRKRGLTSIVSLNLVKAFSSPA